MDKALETTTESGVSVITLGEEYDNLDLDEIDLTGKQLLQLAQTAEPPFIVLDMQRTRFFGSALLGVLFRMWRRLSSRGGRMAVCNATGVCAQVLDVTQADKLWRICDSREAAIRAVKGEI